MKFKLLIIIILVLGVLVLIGVNFNNNEVFVVVKLLDKLLSLLYYGYFKVYVLYVIIVNGIS